MGVGGVSVGEGWVGFEFARNRWMGGLQKLTDYLGRFDTYKGQRV